MQQAQKILPEIMHDPTPENGARVLNSMGVDKSFLNEMYQKYSPYASRVPGLNRGVVSNALNVISRAMGSPNKQPKTNKSQSNFDSKKYPKI